MKSKEMKRRRKRRKTESTIDLLSTTNVFVLLTFFIYLSLEIVGECADDTAETVAMDYEGNYIISNTDEWDAFANIVKNATVSCNAKLTSDITVTKMLGTADKPYRGILDGQGHTLTINYDASAEETAPFNCIKDATIKNLKTRRTNTMNGSSTSESGITGYAGSTSTSANGESIIGSSHD